VTPPVKYRSGAAFRQALEQRLLDRSRDRHTSLVRLRKAVVFDRLLVRLAIAAPDRWVLKGALALDFRLGERTRTTKDMDLVRGDNEAAATSDLIAAQALDLDDFFVKQLMAVDAARLRSALVGVFEGRRQHGLPSRLPAPPTEWTVPYRKLAREVGIDPDLRAGYAHAAAFLDPVLAGRNVGRWDPKGPRGRNLFSEFPDKRPERTRARSGAAPSARRTEASSHSPVRSAKLFDSLCPILCPTHRSIGVIR
jgi:hypothetical protein